MKALPLVLVHGYPFDHSMWYSVIASLGSAAKVFAPDLPGFGRSGPPPDQLPSLEILADYLLHAAENHGHKRFVLVGMSMGGYVALALAEKYPERVAGLGLVSSQAASDTEETKQNRGALIQRLRKEGVSAAVQAILPKMFSPARQKQADLAALVTEGAEKAGVAGLCWALEAMAKRPDRTAMVQSLEIPVLVAHGTEDAIIPFPKARALAEACKKPQFVEIRGAGHATPLETPDHVAAGLATLIKLAEAIEPDTAHLTKTPDTKIFERAPESRSAN
jgi:pimeloyl-ACP methyl ester carboxylesterase